MVQFCQVPSTLLLWNSTCIKNNLHLLCRTTPFSYSEATSARKTINIALQIPGRPTENKWPRKKDRSFCAPTNRGQWIYSCAKLNTCINIHMIKDCLLPNYVWSISLWWNNSCYWEMSFKKSDTYHNCRFTAFITSDNTWLRKNLSDCQMTDKFTVIGNWRHLTDITKR